MPPLLDGTSCDDLEKVYVCAQCSVLDRVCSSSGKVLTGTGRLCFWQHPLVLKAGLKTHEIAGVRLYTGPMFGVYNAHMRKLGQKIEQHLCAGTVVLEVAVQLAKKDLGPFEFVTTGTHA